MPGESLAISCTWSKKGSTQSTGSLWHP